MDLETIALNEIDQSEKEKYNIGLIYVWDLMNKIKWWTKQKQKHGHMEQTDSCQKGEGLGSWMKEGEGISQRT